MLVHLLAIVKSFILVAWSAEAFIAVSCALLILLEALLGHLLGTHNLC